ADPATYSSASRHVAVPNGMDPPGHTSHRAALAPQFDDEQMQRLEPRCRAIAAELVTQMLETGTADVVDALAEPLTLRTLCAFLGWPEEQWDFLGGWTHGNQQAAFTRDPAAGRALAKLLNEHVRANLEAHREVTGDDLDVTHALLVTEVDGQPYDDDAIVSILRNWIAGEGTVAGGLSLLVLRLANDPGLQDRLRANPSLIPAAIEEMLRVDDPLVANRRTATRDVTIGDRTIAAGENLALMWIAANRDPRAFDEPTEVRLDRDMSGSMVWGQGIHLCLGAPMARLQLRVALEELLARTSQVAVAGDVRRSVYPSDGLAEFSLRLA
ncbi:MAG TPA: cytochrome P450, partial [Candidatus Limnocylindria bacterium]|nr:cytochrome P450 [Candidatus Limnocylindria bacterium]